MASEGPVGNGATEVEVVRAIPALPDVPNEQRLPGGVMTPLTPQPVGRLAIRRNQYAVEFPALQGVELTIKRIYISLPVALREHGLETQETSDTTRTFFEKESEAREAYEAKGVGHPGESNEGTPMTYTQPFTRTITTHNITYAKAPPELKDQQTTTTEQSALPVTVTLLIALTNPDGTLWAESFDIPLHYTKGAEAGEYEGTGALSAYADLQNAIPVRPDKTAYGLAVSAFLPITGDAYLSVGQTTIVGFRETGPGAIKLFYDIENVELGK